MNYLSAVQRETIALETEVTISADEYYDDYLIDANAINNGNSAPPPGLGIGYGALFKLTDGSAYGLRNRTCLGNDCCGGWDGCG